MKKNIITFFPLLIIAKDNAIKNGISRTDNSVNLRVHIICVKLDYLFFRCKEK